MNTGQPDPKNSKDRPGGIDLETALEEVAMADRETRVIDLNPRDFSFEQDDRVRAGGFGKLDLGESGYQILRERIKFPLGLARKINRSLNRDVHQSLFEHEFCRKDREPKPLTIAIRGAKIVGFPEGKLLRLSNGHLVRCVRACLSEGWNKTDVRELAISDSGGFRLVITTPLCHSEPKPGDFVHAGIAVEHSPVGEHATQINAFAHRLICQNGMLVPVTLNSANGKKIRKRIRSLDAGQFEQTDATAQVNEHLSQACKQATAAITVLCQLAKRRLEGSIELVVQEFAKAHRFRQKAIEELLTALCEDEAGPAEGTVFDIVMALSRVGTHGPLNDGPSLRQSELRRMQTIAGTLLAGREVERCPHCKRLMERAKPSAN